MSEPSDAQRISEKLQRIGDYRVIAELARGGMGRVYLARRSGQAGFERLFAIKVMHDRLRDDAEAKLMLLDEAHIASRLHHPNVVSVLDVGRYADGHYLVMDYVEGCTLKQLLERTPGYRPPRLLVSIMLDALRGLHAAHTLRNADDEPFQVVHRDVSPDNLLIGLDGCCRVTDFGVAKARERLTDTQVGVCKGKIAFMAPEQLRDGRVDRRVDVWAAGVTLYAALTGEHPFRARENASILHSIMNDEVVPPSQLGMAPPAAFDAVVLRALERDPDKRFPDAQAFADALREVALAADLLGTSADVATWVDTASGYRLAQRRRMIAELSRYESQVSEQSLAVEQESTVEAAPSVPPTRTHRPQRSTSAAVVLIAMAIGGVLGWYGEDEARAYTSAPTVATALPAATPMPVRKAGALTPVTVLSAEPRADDLQVAGEPSLAARSPLTREPPLVGSARAAHEEAPAPSRVLETAPRVLEGAPPAVENAASTVQGAPPALESAQPTMLMESNPYLHGH